MHVAVLGAGTMGHGIAQVSAMAGHDVWIRDIEESIVADGIDAIEQNLEGGIERSKITEVEAEATLDRISGTTSLKEAVSGAGLVIEAVPEQMELKRETVSDVEKHASTDTVIASNTSSLSLTAIASVADDPGRVLGLHYFNPVHIMQLVEVVAAEQTTEKTLSFAHEYVDSLNKTSIEVTDSPGFATSRMGVSLGTEAMRMAQENVASPSDLDTAMELGYNHPVGPLELADLVGLDVRLEVLKYLREELGDRFRPPQILKRKVRAGKLGQKTGEGFYVWKDGDIVDNTVEPEGE
jgi:3-hydroxybutyryl-CoA dehydrogenase